MFTSKEVWEAGRKALGLPVTNAVLQVDARIAGQEKTLQAEVLAKAAATGAPVVEVPKVESSLDEYVFNPADFDFEDREYRVTFKNGNSVECGGMALKHNFCFPAQEILRIEPVEEVGQSL